MFQLLRTVQRGFVVSEAVQRAFLETDRANYVPPGIRAWAYVDRPLDIGHRATISAPHMHLLVADELVDFMRRPNARFLDVGCGSGYLVGLLHRLNPDATIVGIDYIPELVEMSRTNFERDVASDAPLETGEVVVMGGDARTTTTTTEEEEDATQRERRPPRRVTFHVRSGWDTVVTDESERFDAIHVGAAAERLPANLVDALKNNGRMIIPIGTSEQVLYRVDKDANGRVTTTPLFSVRYVPLVESGR